MHEGVAARQRAGERDAVASEVLAGRRRDGKSRLRSGFTIAIWLTIRHANTTASSRHQKSSGFLITSA
jgi:hypothetical protein